MNLTSRYSVHIEVCSEPEVCMKGFWRVLCAVLSNLILGAVAFFTGYVWYVAFGIGIYKAKPVAAAIAFLAVGVFVLCVWLLYGLTGLPEIGRLRRQYREWMLISLENRYHQYEADADYFSARKDERSSREMWRKAEEAQDDWVEYLVTLTPIT